MGSGSSSSGSSTQGTGSLSPAQATLFDLFGGSGINARTGTYVPTGFAGEGSTFQPWMFSAMPGLLQNQPLSRTEQFILGAGPAGARTVFDTAGYENAMGEWNRASNAKKSGLGDRPPVRPNPGEFTRVVTEGDSVFGQKPGFQDLALGSLMATEGLFERGDTAYQSALEGPEAAVALARRGFTEETMPAILERAPGFSSSDLQRELTRGGTDLDTEIAAMREQFRLDALGGLPAYTEARRSNLLSGASDILGMGSAGREFIRDVSPAGDAFRTLEMLQSLTGPSLASFGRSSQQSKSGSGRWG